ncbi:VapA/VapB family virulence-associated protein [Aureisphaera sp. CAU 1614]|uniref:VapA/VapB family virulence-associated protein n=1 Tax=Halomarinibacterium sedimenti TaxID=2857106 RepID=A0A9X1FPR1_9FLAO|nr:VapA/VapB family virulence-associated protein [Halomarinibacterium sedimenti]MBW2938153.1 VapA/VapB family virulence-associated protein [Halomarinibacterium sedimenti]
MALSKEHREAAASEAKKFFNGKISDNELNECLTTVKSGSNSVPAQGSFICAVFYWRIHLVQGSKSFTGNAGGIGFVGGGSTNGDIYLASGVSINELLNNTTSFQFNSAAVYLNVNFFDTNSKFLGSYQGGGIGTCPGTGGGTGVWS